MADDSTEPEFGLEARPIPRMKTSGYSGRYPLLFAGHIQHPDIAGQLGVGENKPAADGGQRKLARRLNVVQTPACVVDVIDSERLAIRPLCGWDQALCPDATEAITIRGEVQQVSVGRPGGTAIYARSVRYGDPLALRRRRAGDAPERRLPG